MRVQRRSVLSGGFAAALAAPLGAPALGQARWSPLRAVRLVVPFPAGGSPDVLTRLMAPHAQAVLGQPVTVENRTGAGATVGSAFVAREPADGHTVLVATISSLTAPFVMPSPPYDPLRDFRHLALLAVTPTVLVTRPDFPARNVREWHDQIRRNPGRFTYASGGVGNPAHLAGELYRSLAGVDITHVAFRGSAPALIELRAGRVDFAILDLPSAQQMIADRVVPALAVGMLERIPALPELPTLHETVVPNFEAYSWVMWWAAAATNDAISDRLVEAGNEALRQPDVQARGAQAGFLLRGTDERGARAHVVAESEKWSRIIRERDIRFEG